MVQAQHVGIVGLDHWMGGIVYIHNIVRALNTLPLEERPRITLFCARTADLFQEIAPLVDQVIVYKPRFQVMPDRKLLYAVRMAKTGVAVGLFREAQPELAIAARRADVKTVFAVTNPYTRFLPHAVAWIPDLQHCEIPDLFSQVERQSRDFRFTRLLKDPGRHVVFSSQHALSDARRHYGQERAQTHILHFATVPAPSWFGDPAEVLGQYHVHTPYLMVCNMFAVHKDHGTLFRAIHLLAQRGVRINLICTGETHDYRRPEYFPALQNEIRQMGIESQCRILGLIPRLNQIMLIRGASAVVQPSLFEGWSTVIEDARALGKRVIASDFPVHLEQNPPGGLFFRQGDEEDCARTIAEHLQLPVMNTPPKSEHQSRVTEFARQFVRIVQQASA